jgi:hypothetical protein
MEGNMRVRSMHFETEGETCEDTEGEVNGGNGEWDGTGEAE